MAVPLTDQAIAKIKDLIISGEFTAGAKLPREQDLAARLGLSRNSLREAVRALSLIGVLDTRVGDGTYVTALDADVLLTGMGFVGDLLEGATLLEVHQVRRILEPVATGLAATRLTEADFVALEECLEAMDGAETTEEFIDADSEFHRIIVGAAGNATLASVIQNLSGGMMRARLWRTITEHDAVEITKQRHRDILVALRAGDAEQASAADLVHLADGERWLQGRIARGQTLRGEIGGKPNGTDARAPNGGTP
jgi:GntR family transcriptional regulator, transcriptional repressor for pyruvate dehydrogenase complex